MKRIFTVFCTILLMLLLVSCEENTVENVISTHNETTITTAQSTASTTKASGTKQKTTKITSEKTDLSTTYLTTASEKTDKTKATKSSKTTKTTKQTTKTTEKSKKDNDMIDIIIEINNKTFSAKLYNNKSAKAFAEQMPLTLDMDELNGNEKYYYLDESLPVNSSRPAEIKTGDLMLFGSDCLVLFYESFSTSYSYTSLGFIENPNGLADAVGGGSAKVTFSVVKK